MKRWLLVVGYGMAELVLAAAMSLGAFALAGRQIGGPAPQVQPSAGNNLTPVGASEEPTFSLAPTNSESPEDDHGGEDDSSGSGGGPDDSHEDD
jgi:hypothetical protein